jgi:hypothetical protein
MLLLEFIMQTKGVDFEDHDCAGAWPVSIDSFVGWYRERKGLAALE